MFVALLLWALSQNSLMSVLPDANTVTIIDGGKFRPYNKTGFDAGPAAGDGLNGHFFPGIIGYNTGRYTYAATEFGYVIRNHWFLNENPRKSEFLSITYYLRGMIYLYHAKGVGRHQLAKADFEAAVNWNPANYNAYLELSRVFSDLGFTSEAATVVQHLLELKPPKDVADEAEAELKKLATTKPD
jgi:tetratricopeptide (TPR) repeat protein